MTQTVVQLRYDRPGSASDLVRFHARHKLLLMAHAPAAVSALGRLVAGAGRGEFPAIWHRYEVLFRATLEIPVSRGRHVNVLMHAAGYFRGVLDETGRRTLARTIQAFEQGEGTLEASIRLIRTYAERYSIDYLTSQVYLQTPPPFDEP